MQKWILKREIDVYKRQGYMRENTELVLSVVSSREVGRVRKLVHSIDSSAFLIISRVTEVRGRGFTQEKEYK